MIRAVLRLMAWLGLAEPLEESEEEEERRAEQRHRHRWTPVVVMAILAAGVGGYVIGAKHQTLTIRLEPPDHAAAVRAVAGDAFRQEHGAAFLGGTVQTIYAPSSGELLVSVQGVSAPPAGYSLRASLVCGGKTLQLGTLAPRFFGRDLHATGDNSFIVSESEDCTRVILTEFGPRSRRGSTITMDVTPVDWNRRPSVLPA
jgi:hypothetical protein